LKLVLTRSLGLTLLTKELLLTAKKAMSPFKPSSPKVPSGTTLLAPSAALVLTNLIPTRPLVWNALVIATKLWRVASNVLLALLVLTLLRVQPLLASTRRLALKTITSPSSLSARTDCTTRLMCSRDLSSARRHRATDLLLLKP
jgi:hypothetical protein